MPSERQRLLAAAERFAICKPGSKPHKEAEQEVLDAADAYGLAQAKKAHANLDKDGSPFHSNAAGENLGGIFCSKGCVDLAVLSGANP